MSHCWTPRLPAQMNLGDQATPRDKVDATIMVSCQHPRFHTQGTPQKGTVGPESPGKLHNGARALPAALSCNPCPFLSIPHPLSKCENSEAIARNGKS